MAGVLQSTDAVNAMATKLDAATGAAIEFGKGVAAEVAKGNFTGAGTKMAEGVAKGIYAGAKSLYDAGAGVGTTTYNAISEKAGIQSPAKAFEPLGHYIDLGIAKGIREGGAPIDEAIATMVETALENGKKAYQFTGSEENLVSRIIKSRLGTGGKGKSFGRTGTSTGDPKLDAYMASAGAAKGLPAGLLESVAFYESGFNPKAQSPTGPRGLFQFTRATGSASGLDIERDKQGNYLTDERLNPYRATDAAAAHLADLSRKFKGNIDLVVAAYNQGEGAVKKAGNIVPDIAEAKLYVRSIGVLLREFGGVTNKNFTSGNVAMPKLVTTTELKASATKVASNVLNSTLAEQGTALVKQGASSYLGLLKGAAVFGLESGIKINKALGGHSYDNVNSDAEARALSEAQVNKITDVAAVKMTEAVKPIKDWLSGAHAAPAAILPDKLPLNFGGLAPVGSIFQPAASAAVGTEGSDYDTGRGVPENKRTSSGRATLFGGAPMTATDASGQEIKDPTKAPAAMAGLKAAGGEAKALLKDSFGAFAQGLGGIVEQFVLMGETGPQAMRKMAAGVLASLASQAAVKSIFYLAEGIAALTNPFTAYMAPGYFTASAIMGGIAGGAAIAGRVVASGIRKDGQASGTGNNGENKDVTSEGYAGNRFDVNSPKATITKIGYNADYQTYAGGSSKTDKLLESIDRKLNPVSGQAMVLNTIKNNVREVGRAVTSAVNSDYSLGNRLGQRIA